jgi:hypothetical protein
VESVNLGGKSRILLEVLEVVTICGIFEPSDTVHGYTTWLPTCEEYPLLINGCFDIRPSSQNCNVVHRVEWPAIKVVQECFSLLGKRVDGDERARSVKLVPLSDHQHLAVVVRPSIGKHKLGRRLRDNFPVVSSVCRIERDFAQARIDGVRVFAAGVGGIEDIGRKVDLVRSWDVNSS